jgi:MFS family permease
VGAPRWLSIIICAWGVSATCFAFMRTPTQFYLLRFILGAAEAGAFPGMW